MADDNQRVPTTQSRARPGRDGACCPRAALNRVSPWAVLVLVVGCQSTPAGLPRAADQGERLYTIYVCSFTGPDHARLAEDMSKLLAQLKGLKDFHVLHQDESSSVLYGHYRSVHSATAQRDLKRIRSLTDGQGRRRFPATHLFALASADPPAPPEWDLRRLNAKYSLQVGVYFGSPQRKRAAVEMTRVLREAGHEAYYFHAPAKSIVCVGAFGPDVLVREQRLVHGRVVASNRIVDPKVVELSRKLPFHENGQTIIISGRDPETGRLVKQKQPSLLVNVQDVIRLSQPTAELR